MTIYKTSESLKEEARKGFAGIVFDCDGVLIDASGSYGEGLDLCAKSLASVLGFSPEKKSLDASISALQRLGTFNNDWDTLAVLTAFCYSDPYAERDELDSVASVSPLSERLRRLEDASAKAIEYGDSEDMDFSDLRGLADSLAQGTTREQVIARLMSEDVAMMQRYYDAVSYPKPVGEGLLATFYDEIIYGPEVFQKTYGFPVAMRKLSVPGLITKERNLVSPASLEAFSKLSEGNLGIITGRPRVPTIHTMGRLYEDWFRNPDTCLFTGDYLLSVDEVKPSPRPMVKVSGYLADKTSPIIYVGDSGEDVLMAKRANEKSLLDGRVRFVGIAASNEKLDFFKRQGEAVDCIVSSVNEIPSALGVGQ